MADLDRVNFINPRGDLVSIPRDATPQALQSGYSLATPDQEREFFEKERYGKGLGKEATAFGLGALRGATFSGSDWIAKKAGYAEPVAAYKKYNPMASGAGEVAGVIGSSLLAPEVSLAGRLGRGAEAVGTSLAEHLAAPAAEALSASSPMLAKGVSGLGEIGSMATSGGLEGAAFGGAEGLSEAALGDKDLTAENILAEVGHGALWGAGIGGTIGLGKVALPEAAKLAKASAGKTYETLFGRTAADEAGIKSFEPGLVTKPILKAGAAVSGKPYEELVEGLTAKDLGLMPEAEKSKFVKQVAGDLQDTYNKTKELSGKTTMEVKPEAFAEHLKDIDPAKAKESWSELVDKLAVAQKTILDDPDLYAKRYVKPLGDMKDGLLRRITDDSSTSDYFNEFEGVKRNLDAITKKIKPLAHPAELASKDILKDISDTIRTNLENESIWGRAAATQQSYNAMTKKLLDSRDLLEKKFMVNLNGKFTVDPNKVKTYFSQINGPGGEIKGKILKDFLETTSGYVDHAENIHKMAGIDFDKKSLADLLSKHSADINTASERFSENPELGQGFFADLKTAAIPFVGNLPIKIAAQVMKTLANPDELTAKLANIHKASQSTSEAIAKAAKKSFEPIIKTAEVGKEALKKALDSDVVEKNIKEINERATKSPEELVKHLDDKTKDLFNAAPGVAGSLQMGLIKGMLFLKSKIPDWSDNGSALPFDNKKEPTPAQKIKFVRYYQAVEDPLSVFKDVVSGHPTAEGIETLKTVYPSLYEHMQHQLISQITDKKAKNPDITMPYQKRLSISDFLGMPLDSTNQPMNIAANQAIISQRSAEKNNQQQQVKPTSKGESAINLASRSKTGMEKVATRKEA